mgnify:CR=1 FL=1
MILWGWETLLYSDTINNRGWDKWKPFLCFDYRITTNQFHTTNYKKPLSKDRIRLHEEIIKLHNKGWGYTKIHRHLIKNEFEIGKSRTTVDSIIKKIKKREKFLSQPIIDRMTITFLNKYIFFYKSQNMTLKK